MRPGQVHMRSGTAHIQARDLPQKVNSLLVDRWGISLFRFAQVFAVAPVDHFVQRRAKPLTYREVTEIKAALRKMVDGILRGTRKIDRILDRAGGKPLRDISDAEILSDKAIRAFYVEYIAPREILAAYFERTQQLGKKGTGLNKKSIIAVGWGTLVAKSGNRIDWKLLGDLYFWLWGRLSHFSSYREWAPSDGIEDYLKIQYHRHRFKGSLEEFVAENIPWLGEGHEKEDFDFIKNLILYKWADNKITDKQVLSLVLNISLDWIIASQDGLTIFSPGGSFADPTFGHLYSWLRARADHKILAPPPFELPSFAKTHLIDREPPFQGTALGDYFLYAADLFLTRKKEPIKPDPIIVFPDQSFYCPGL